MFQGFILYLTKSVPLAVPVESIRKDDKGFYVWKGKGQKIAQPESIMADKFQVEKVYIEPAEYKTYINGISKEYQMLKKSAGLEEYDVILGARIPQDLKDNDTVVYKKYKLLFEPEDKLKVEIPDLVKPGFYVPASSVVQKGTDEFYVYINDNNKAKCINVKLLGGTNKYYNIESEYIKEGTEIVLFDEDNFQIANGTVIKANNVSELFVDGNEKLSVSVIPVKELSNKNENITVYGKIVSIDKPRIAFSTWDSLCGEVVSTKAVGSNVMSRVTDINGDYYKDYGVLATVDDEIFKHNVQENKALVKSAKAKLDYAKSIYNRKKHLFDINAVKKEEYDDAVEGYDNAKAEFEIAKANLEDAESSYQLCSITTAYPGVVDKIITYPGNWSDKGNPIVQIDLMSPIGLDINLNRELALKVFKEINKKVYPVGVDNPVGTINQRDRLTYYGIQSLLDNFLVQDNDMKNDDNLTEIESYSGVSLYVARFNSLLNKSALAVPIESLHEDDNGYYVWKGAGQKVCQPNFVIADKFEMKKVYVKPGDEKTYINGPSCEYRKLIDAGDLEEYDFVLGKNIPEGLKNNEFVFYNKYKYLFNPGEIVKVEIDNEIVSGFSIPKSCVIQKAVDDTYIYIVDNGKAKLTKINLVGENETDYIIEGNTLENDFNVISLDASLKNKIYDGAGVVTEIVAEEVNKNISVMKLKEIELPASEQAFYCKVKSLDIPNIKFTNWTERYARVDTTLPVGFPVMSKVTDLDGNVVNSASSVVSEMETNAYSYLLEAEKAGLKIAETQYKNAHKQFVRYDKLVKTDSVSKETYDKAIEYFYTSKANLIEAEAAMMIAEENVKVCTRYSPYSGVIK